MSTPQQLHLICYDITDDKRLRRIARYLTKSAFRVQYSVFVGEFSDSALKKVLADLDKIIDPSTDDVRCYPLPREMEAILLGHQIFPEDILLIRNGTNILRLGSATNNKKEQKAKKLEKSISDLMVT